MLLKMNYDLKMSEQKIPSRLITFKYLKSKDHLILLNINILVLIVFILADVFIFMGQTLKVENCAKVSWILIRQKLSIRFILIIKVIYLFFI